MSSFPVSDFDGDGKLDLVLSSYGAYGVYVLINDGSGGFMNPATFAVGLYPRSVAVGDFNRDGKLDLVTANEGSNDLTVLLAK